MLYRVVAPHYVAGFITKANVVVQAAPILKWTIGRNRWDVCCRLRSYRNTTVQRLRVNLKNGRTLLDGTREVRKSFA